MNNSRTFAAVLSGLTLLAVSAVAQSSQGSATGSRSGAATTRSGTSSATAPSSVATSPSSNTAATSATNSSGSMNSSATSSTNANSDSFGPGASQFKSLDTDNDGRISRAEFTASGSAALSASTDTSADTSATASGKTEKKHWWSRHSSDKSNDSDPGETFNKLDTDHDGFLSQSELASANAKLKK